MMKRFLKAGLVALLGFVAAPAAFSFDINTMSEKERTQFRQEIRAYLLDNPEVLMEAIGVLENRQAQQQVNADRDLARAYAAEIREDGYSWVGGNPDGDITLVEFMDYRCSYCRKAHSEVRELVETDGNIRLIVKEYPILGEDSTMSARFAIATQQVAGDEAYSRVHDALITFRGNVTEGNLRRLANDLDLDATEILARMNGAEVNAVLQANSALGQNMAINGTPTFVLEDQLLRGYVPLDNMRQIVAATRAEG